MSHIDAVEHYSRLDSITGHALRERIMQIEMTIRIEWARVCQYEPEFSLSDAITLVSKRQQLWPCVTEFRSSHLAPPPKKGAGG